MLSGIIVVAARVKPQAPIRPMTNISHAITRNTVTAMLVKRFVLAVWSVLLRRGLNRFGGIDEGHGTKNRMINILYMSRPGYLESAMLKAKGTESSK